MSNSSTATKLDALIGLERAKKAVLRILSEASHVHAVLLYGAEGAGKSLLADALAQGWMCRSPGPEGACGECRTCESFERGVPVDLLRISPLPPSNLIRLASISPVRDPHETAVPMISFFRTAPLAATHKVAIIYEADRLTNDACNALLKTLEEPLPHAKLILTTRAVGLVVPTIVSRCLAIQCELPQEGVLTQIASSPLAVKFAEGAPGRLRQIERNLPGYERLASLADDLRQASSPSALRLAEEFRSICDGIGGEDSARAGIAEGLRALGTILASSGAPGAWLCEIAEAHRRIVGNGSATFVTDSLFARLLGSS